MSDEKVWGLPETFFSLLFILVGGSVYWQCKQGEQEPLGPDKLEGSFQAEHPELGSWRLAPSHCLDGSERGFRGIVFQFPLGSPIKEVRVDNEVEGANIVEVRFFDPNRPPVRVVEVDCTSITGFTEKRPLEINGRNVAHLRGDTRLACPTIGLSGYAKYNGCWPTDVAFRIK